MKIIKVKNYDEMSTQAFKIICDQLRKKPDSVLGLATGSTPEGIYELLVKKNHEISFKNVTTFNLDEYIGLPIGHSLSYRFYMDEKLFNKIDINKENTHIPSSVGNVKKLSYQYDQLIQEHGGIDLQILGIGENGHIAFNEPGSSFQAGTRIVKLTESTINANARYFNSKADVPKEAVSMGIATILKAKKIILLASGKNKAKAIKKTIENEISTSVPASSLKRHKDVTLIVDAAASSLLD